MAYKTPSQLKKYISDKHYYTILLGSSDFDNKEKVQNFAKIIVENPNGALSYNQDYDSFESIEFSYETIKSEKEMEEELQQLIKAEEEKKKHDKERAKLQRKTKEDQDKAEFKRLAKKYPELASEVIQKINQGTAS